MTSSSYLLASPLPLGLVLRPNPGAPTQAEVLSFHPQIGSAEAPLATFAAAMPERIEHPFAVHSANEYAGWMRAHPNSPVSVVEARGIQAVYGSQAERDAALAAALSDPDIEGVFTPQWIGYWTYPEIPSAAEPFALFAGFTQCDGSQWWGATPVPVYLDTTSQPIRLESPGQPAICGVPPPPFRQVFAWQLPGLPAGNHAIEIYRIQQGGAFGPADTVAIVVAAGVGEEPALPVSIPALGVPMLLALCGCVLLAITLLRSLR